MMRLFLTLTLLKVALCRFWEPVDAYAKSEEGGMQRAKRNAPEPGTKDLCIPQGNKCMFEWQCCKGFHCEIPHYKNEKHCIADHEQLSYITETDTEDPADPARTSTDPESQRSLQFEPVNFIDSEASRSGAQPSAREMMMRLMEAGLQQLTRGKPIKMKVKVKNPEVLLGKISKQSYDGDHYNGYHGLSKKAQKSGRTGKWTVKRHGHRSLSGLGQTNTQGPTNTQDQYPEVTKTKCTGNAFCNEFDKTIRQRITTEKPWWQNWGRRTGKWTDNRHGHRSLNGLGQTNTQGPTNTQDQYPEVTKTKCTGDAYCNENEVPREETKNPWWPNFGVDFAK